MKKIITVALFSCVIILSLTDWLYAGALDRQNVQPRTNEATQSMIRVPGVVGQDSANAMSSLQQAGLNVSVLEAKKMPKGMEGAANMEGKVVSQTPNPGGMAMYGTTVNIYVWKPTEGAASYSSEIPSNNTWGTNGSYPTNNQTQPTYSGTQTQQQPQMYQQQMGTTGTTTQQSQPFQVQQYYYPPAGDASASSNQQDQTNQGQQTTDPNTYQQPVDPNASQPTADPNAYQQPVDPNTYQQPADPSTSQQTETSEQTGTSQQTDTSQQTETSEQAPKEQQTSTPAQ